MFDAQWIVRYVTYVLLLVVALMTGILSVFREIMGIYAPPGMIPASDLFWACTRVAFALAMVAAWIVEHRKVGSLEAGLKVPDFQGEIGTVIGGSFMVGGTERCLLAVGAVIRNPRGPSSAALEWDLSILFADGKVIRGQRFPFSGKDMTVPAQTGQAVTLPAAAYLPVLMGKAIDAGGLADGWFMMSFDPSEVDEFYGRNGVLRLEFRDAATMTRHSVETADPPVQGFHLDAAAE
jgi:hypothetical protein